MNGIHEHVLEWVILRYVWALLVTLGGAVLGILAAMVAVFVLYSVGEWLVHTVFACGFRGRC